MTPDYYENARGEVVMSWFVFRAAHSSDIMSQLRKVRRGRRSSK